MVRKTVRKVWEAGEATVKIRYAVAALVLFLVFALVAQYQFHQVNEDNRRQDAVDNARSDYLNDLQNYQTEVSVWEACKSRVAGRESGRTERFGFIDELDSFFTMDGAQPANPRLTELLDRLRDNVDEFLPSLDPDVECGQHPVAPTVPPVLAGDDVVPLPTEPAEETP